VAECGAAVAECGAVGVDSDAVGVECGAAVVGFGAEVGESADRRGSDEEGAMSDAAAERVETTAATPTTDAMVTGVQPRPITPTAIHAAVARLTLRTDGRITVKALGRTLADGTNRLTTTAGIAAVTTVAAVTVAAEATAAEMAAAVGMAAVGMEAETTAADGGAADGTWRPTSRMLLPFIPMSSLSFRKSFPLSSILGRLSSRC
jgi:hypothetical protein